MRAGSFQPRVDRAFRLDDVVEAHRHLESNRQFGKIVLTVD
ncbi:zinc-binding dehydrogenase [Amycolatopsis sp. EV170708-02-1]|nr:zinc-binding dehydrogenase [Amycolatopsis sp. EV170708-02-1]UMP05628.1 zinc-binding dehydrogenase [Amycolatopsis sp. EV170708-02-1]